MNIFAYIVFGIWCVFALLGILAVLILLIKLKNDKF